MEDGEQEPLTIYRLSKIIFVGPVLIAGLGTAALWYVWTSDLYLMHNLGPMVLGLSLYESFYPTIFLVCRIATAIIAMGFATQVLVCLIRYMTTELRVFSNRVLWRTGFISRDMFTTSVVVCLIRYMTTELRVFSNRVLWRTGFISRDMFTTSVREIIGVQLTQSVLGRILGFGSISISTRGDDQIVADLISGAPQASRTIMALKNNAE